jgi:hypothetical protein
VHPLPGLHQQSIQSTRFQERRDLGKTVSGFSDRATFEQQVGWNVLRSPLSETEKRAHPLSTYELSTLPAPAALADPEFFHFAS